MGPDGQELGKRIFDSLITTKHGVENPSARHMWEYGIAPPIAEYLYGAIHVTPTIVTQSLTAPPGSPGADDIFIVGSPATGNWVGHEDEYAWKVGSTWYFKVPREGDLVWISDEPGYFGWTGTAWAGMAGPGVIYSHSLLSNLNADDHGHYALLAGRTGGQLLIGGTGSGDDLTFQTTSHGTKGSYIFSEMTIAGFLKNTVAGVVTGGNSIASGDITDFDEAAQDAVGTILVDSTTIDFTYTNGTPDITAAVIPGGVDHNSLLNVGTGDVHTMYALLAGRAGGQTLYGGNATSNNLYLSGTSHVTKGYVQVGTGGAPGHFTGGSNGQLYVTGIAEFDEATYCDGTFTTANTHYAAGSTFLMTAVTGPGFYRMPDAAAADSFHLFGNSGDETFVFTTNTNRGVKHDHASQTNPTIFGHSAISPDIDPAQWWSLTHDQSKMVVGTGTGAVQLAPATYVHVGTTGTPGHADSNGDLYVYQELEVDGATYLDGGASLGSVLHLPDDIDLAFGNTIASPDAQVSWNTSQTIDALILGLSESSRNLIICDQTDVDYDWGHAAGTDPTLYIQSRNQAASQWMSFFHDGAQSIWTTGAGAFELRGAIIRLVSNTSSGVNKQGRFVTSHYTSATEEEVMGFLASNTASANHVYYGGGSTTANTATDLNFYTAPNTTTLYETLNPGNTLRMVINTAGLVTIGYGGTPTYVGGSGDLYLNDDLEVEDSGYFKVAVQSPQVRGTNTASGVLNLTGTTHATKGYVRVGTSGTPGHLTAASDGELYVLGASEFDGLASFDANVDALLGLDVSGGPFTFTGTAGSWTIAQADSALTQTGSGQVTFTGNVDMGAGLDLSAGVLTLPLGAVGAPSLTFVGHLTDGLYHDGADIHLVKNGQTILECLDIRLHSSVPIKLSNNSALFIGEWKSSLEFETTNNTVDTLIWGLDDTSRHIIFCEYADIATDWNRAADTNPTLYIQSADATSVTDYIGLRHNQTDAEIVSGAGGIWLKPASGAVDVVAATGNPTLTLYEGATGRTSLYHHLTSNYSVLSNTEGQIRVSPFDGQLYVAGTLLTLSGSGTTATRLEIGAAGTGNRYAYIDLIGDTVYTDYGLRIIRNDSGENASSQILHRGTGSLVLKTTDVAALVLEVNAATTVVVPATKNELQVRSSTADGTTDPKLTLCETTTERASFYHDTGSNYSVIANTEGAIRLTPTTYLHVGSTGTPSYANSDGDLYVYRDLEVDGMAYFDGGATVATSWRLGDDVELQFGAPDSYLDWSTAQATANTLVWGLGASNSLILTTATNRNEDHSLAVQDNPTIALYSALAPTDSDQERVLFTHDGTDAAYSTTIGGHRFDIEAQRARGTMTLTGQPVASETFVLNATTFTAVASGATGDQFNIGATYADTADNIAAVINSGSESANAAAWRSSDGGEFVIIEWLVAGTAGNLVTFTESMTNTTADGSGTLGSTNRGTTALTPLIAYTGLGDGQVCVDYGTTGRPGLAFIGDENTGLSRQANGEVGVTSNGTLKYKLGGIAFWMGADDLQIDPTNAVNPKITLRESTVERVSLSHNITANETVLDNSEGPIRVTPTTYLHVGTTGTPGHADSDGDLYVYQDLEVDGTLYADASATIGTGLTLSAGVLTLPLGAVGAPSLTFAGNTTDGIYHDGDDIHIVKNGVSSLEFQDSVMVFNDNLRITGNTQIVFGGSANCSLEWETTNNTVDTLVLGLDNTNRHMIICEAADVNTDWNRAAATNPTLYIQSADAASITDYIGFYHDQTDGVITTGTGDLLLAPFGSVRLDDDTRLSLGSSKDSTLEYDVAIQTTAATLIWGLPATSHAIIFCDKADIATNFSRAADTNPTIYVQSADAASATDYIGFRHNQTDAEIVSGAGGIYLIPASGTVRIDGDATDPKLDLYTTVGTTVASFYYDISESEVWLMSTKSGGSLVLDSGGTQLVLDDTLASEVATLNVPFEITEDDAVTNAITTVLTLAHTTSGTPADDIGARLLYQVEGFGSVLVNAAAIDAILPTGGQNNEGRLTFSVWDDYTADALVQVASLRGDYTNPTFTLDESGTARISLGYNVTTKKAVLSALDSSADMEFVTNAGDWTWDDGTIDRMTLAFSAAETTLSVDAPTGDDAIIYLRENGVQSGRLMYDVSASTVNIGPSISGEGLVLQTNAGYLDVYNGTTTQMALFEDTGSTTLRLNSPSGGDTQIEWRENTVRKAYSVWDASGSTMYHASDADLSLWCEDNYYVAIRSRKTTTGNPTGVEGRIVINTVDNTLKMYCDGAWRTLVTW